MTVASSPPLLADAGPGGPLFREDTMARTIHCRDLGPDCDFVAQGRTDDEVMARVAEHARSAHGIDPLPGDLARRAHSQIRDEDVPLEAHEPPFTSQGGITAPKFGSAGSGGLEYERLPERHDDEP